MAKNDKDTRFVDESLNVAAHELDKDGGEVVFGGDLLEKGYGIVSVKAMEDKRVPAAAKGIYAYFCAHANSVTHASFPSVSTICEHMHMTEKTYNKHRNLLVSLGYLTIISGGKNANGKFRSNRYVVNVKIPRVLPEIVEVPDVVDNSRKDKVINNPQESPTGKNYLTVAEILENPSQESPTGKNYLTVSTGETFLPYGKNSSSNNDDDIYKEKEAAAAGTQASSSEASDTENGQRPQSQPSSDIQTEPGVEKGTASPQASLDEAVSRLMHKNIGAEKPFNEVRDAYGKALAEGYAVDAIEKDYELFVEDYFSDHDRPGMAMNLVKFLTSGTGIRSYDEIRIRRQSGTAPRKMKPPTYEEVEAYILEKGYDKYDPEQPTAVPVDANAFYEYYTMTNWCKKDGTPLKSWKVAVATTWRRSRFGHGANPKSVKNGNRSRKGYGQVDLEAARIKYKEFDDAAVDANF